MKMRAGSIVLGALLLVCPSARSEEPEPISPVHLFTYPMGKAPELMSDIPCGEGRFGCDAGFGAIGPNRTLYFYDYYKNNVKVLDLHQGTLVALIEGPPDLLDFLSLSHAHGLPHDMVVTPEGAIVLLVDDSGGIPGAYRFWRYSASDSSWSEIVSVPKSDFGVETNEMGYGTLRMSPNGSIDLFFLHLRLSIPIEALRDRVSGNTVTSVWKDARRGMVGTDGYYYEQTHVGNARSGPMVAYVLTVRDRSGVIARTDRLPVQGGLVGVLPSGKAVLSTAEGIAVIDRGGSISEIGILPRPSLMKSMVGLYGPILVSREGGIYWLVFTERGLEVHEFDELR